MVRCWFSLRTTTIRVITFATTASFRTPCAPRASSVIMAGRAYCTYFDHNYLSRGLALYYSLQRHAPGSRLWVLCLSDEAYRTLASLDLADMIPRRLVDVDAHGAHDAVE